MSSEIKTTDKDQQSLTTESNTLHPCIKCEKKSPYNMICRCNKWTCAKHRLPAKHNCSFDFAIHANQTNESNLVKIETAKIETI